MAAIAITRGREVSVTGRKIFRGLGTWNANDTSGTLRVPNGNIINFRGVSAFAAATPVSYALDVTPSNGIVSRDANGDITVKRSAGTDTNGTFLFEVEYDAL